MLRPAWLQLGEVRVSDSESFWEKRKQSCKNVREQWAVSVRRYLCFWILRDNYDRGGQTQDSQSVSLGFKSQPCNLLVIKFGVSRLTCPSLFPWTGSGIPSTPRLRFTERAQGDAIRGMILKQFTGLHVKYYYPFFSFWVIEKLSIESCWLTIKVREQEMATLISGGKEGCRWEQSKYVFSSSAP